MRAAQRMLCALTSEHCNSTRAMPNCQTRLPQRAPSFSAKLNRENFKMKRCPKCSRTFTTNTQKFCTHDGVVLETVEAGPATVGSETVRIDASDLNDDDLPTKAISRELASEITGDFDPLKTVMSRPEGTFTGGPRNTSDIGPTPRVPSQVSPTPPQAAMPMPPPQSSPSAPTMALGSGPLAASAPLSA